MFMKGAECYCIALSWGIDNDNSLTILGTLRRSITFILSTSEMRKCIVRSPPTAKERDPRVTNLGLIVLFS